MMPFVSCTEIYGVSHATTRTIWISPAPGMVIFPADDYAGKPSCYVRLGDTVWRLAHPARAVVEAFTPVLRVLP